MMKSTVQASVVLLGFTVFTVNGLSHLRSKRQVDETRFRGNVNWNENFDPTVQDRNSRLGQQNSQFGQFGNQNPFFGQQNTQNQDPTFVHGQFNGFGQFRPNDIRTPVGNGLTFGSNGGQILFQTTQSPPIGRTRSNGFTNPGQGGLVSGNQRWSISSQTTTPRGFFNPGQSGIAGGRQNWPINSGLDSSTTTTTPPSVRTTPSQAYLRCLGSCPSTMEYNPVCGSDTQNYHNMQRLMCANQCGNNVQFIRLGTCNPL